MRQNSSFQKFIVLSVVVSLLLTACGGPSKSDEEIAAEETLAAIYAEGTAAAMEAQQEPEEASPEPTAEPPQPEEPPPAPWTEPGEPPEPERTLADSNSSYNAWENRATQGDNFLNGLYERPFTSGEMDYRPDLDITEVDFAYDDAYFYFTIRLFGMNMDGGGLKGMYGVEFDRTLTGRGDLLVWLKNPAKDWSIEGVKVFSDNNRDVGGVKPVVAETGFNGSGYDGMIEMDETRNAYARIDPEDGNAIQIAVSAALLDNPPEFAWGAWADDGLIDPQQFDYNDRMGPSAAGSPILGEDYPLKDLFNLDNTCRLPYGTAQSAEVPGMCRIGIPTKSSSGCKWQCTNPLGKDEVSCARYQGQWVCK